MRGEYPINLIRPAATIFFFFFFVVVVVVVVFVYLNLFNLGVYTVGLLKYLSLVLQFVPLGTK